MPLARLLLVGLGCAVALACQTRAVPVDAMDGNLRLGRDVVPVHYSLDLKIDPSRERFSGEATIRVEVAVATSTLRMHAAGLKLERVTVESGGQRYAPRHASGPNGALALEFARPLGPGPATLRFAWEGPLPETPYGLYRVIDDGRWYAFTQFEPLEARKAFPCFDQPEFKTPFAVTLRVPAGQIGLGNGPTVLHRSEPGEEVFVFAETRPLPTYLVAFAVGAFDLVEGTLAADDPPLRLVATRGKGRLAGFALERTPRILAWLDDYFARPYPFAKLDLVAVPNFGAGAMENVGLVTFRERLLLVAERATPIWSRYRSQSVIAHELAHMWYGNLVTMAWWDDLWLNESFATWMAAKVLADVDPELESALDAITSTQRTMELDSRRDARQIRQPIRNEGDIYNAFDGITYGKGAAVLRMTEAWIGERPFREGVRSYMRDHAYESGGTEELLEALEGASGLPVGETIQGFLDQPGTPLVQLELRCDANAPPSLHLTQTRALPAGSDAPIGEPWRIPVCVALGTGDPEAPRARECFVLASREQRVALTQVTRCPAWVYPNEGARGYYRFGLSPDALVALVRDHLGDLEPAEVVAIPGNSQALLEAELLPVGAFLEVLTQLADHEHRHVVGAVSEALWALHAVGVADDESELGDAFAARVRALLGSQLDRVGVMPQPGETVDARMRRSFLLRTLAILGREPWIRSRARSFASAFVADPGAADEEALALLLPIAAVEGDAALWQALVDIVADPPTPEVRGSVVRSLGRFKDPVLIERSLDLVLGGRLRAQDYRTVERGISAARRPVAWKWLTRNYAAIVSKLGPMTSAGLPHIASGLCTQEDAKSVEAFFASSSNAAGRAVVPEGTARNVRLVVEEITRCARLRATIEGDLAAALR